MSDLLGFRTVSSHVEEPTNQTIAQLLQTLTTTKESTMTMTITETEAEMAIRKALHELDVQRGNGVFNIPALRRILEQGVPREPERLVRRPVTQASDLLGLDDIDGR